MQQLDKIFYGITPSEHRKILRSLFENEIKNRPNISFFGKTKRDVGKSF